jgi:hypothetical protein
VTADGAPRAGRREWTGLALIALPCLLYSMKLTELELAAGAHGPIGARTTVDKALLEVGSRAP